MKKNILFYFLIGIWLLVNLLTAWLTELYDDEAYYWMYSNFPDWGYFDHPPIVGLMIRSGFQLFGNELGVRLFAVIAVTITLVITYKLSSFKDPWLFMALVFSSFAINLIGFVSLPDNFILVYGALFLLLYKKYLEKDSYLIALLLAIVIALMMYSKYHGVLILFFTILSNLSVLKRKSFWVMALVSLLLFMPHIFWQVENQFPSVRYHLVDRNSKAYSIHQTLEFLGGQPVYYGPIIGFIMFYAAFRYKISQQFDKVLKFNFIGTLLFFLVMSFNGVIEANWTIIIILPLLVLTMNYLKGREKLIKWTKILAIPGIVLILLVRIHLYTDLFTIPEDATSQFKGHRYFARKIMKEAHGLPVVANSYQKASLLSFYSGEIIPSLNVSARKNQFNLWDLDRLYQNDTVLFVNKHLTKGKIVSDNKGERVMLTKIYDLPVFNKVFCSVTSVEPYNHIKNTYIARIRVESPLHYSEFHPSSVHTTYLKLYSKDSGSGEICLIEKTELQIRSVNGPEISMEIAPKPGRYQIWCALETEGLGTWNESKSIVFNNEE